MARPIRWISRGEEYARLRLEELALFLEPVALSDAQERGPRPRRSPSWWARAVCRAEHEGVLISPGTSPLWRLTHSGRWHVERWMAKQKAAA